MKAEELAVIKERAGKATPGGWKTDEHRVYSESVDDDYVCEMWLSFDDAEFIAHAREDVPKLVAEVERLQNRVDELECAIIEHANPGTELSKMIEEASK